MNDSDFGLTASLWTKDRSKVYELEQEIETGTVFWNRCDFVDPELAWVGIKNSGKGCSVGQYGFDQVTRPKSFHHKLPA
jgi:acyl-CoA reductase-like NAD-dependent aldehyde dehydrogenase